jgi:hypothetical protein
MGVFKIGSAPKIKKRRGTAGMLQPWLVSYGSACNGLDSVS